LGSLTIATLDGAAWVRVNRATLDPVAWRWLTALVCVGAFFTTAPAARYASERQRRLGDWVGWLAIAAVGLSGVVGILVFGTLDASVPIAPRSPLGDLGAVIRLLLAEVVLLTVLGMLGDLRPAAERTQRRLADLRTSRL